MELEYAGCHVLGLKDMAGPITPAAAPVLIKAMRDEVGLPVPLHTHDTSAIAAVEAGVDAIDAAIESMSGTTSQLCLGSIVQDAIRKISS